MGLSKNGVAHSIHASENIAPEKSLWVDNHFLGGYIQHFQVSNPYISHMGSVTSQKTDRKNGWLVSIT